MSFDLTDKNIQDTFQNLLQKTGSDGRLFDLKGNQVRNLTIDGTLTANTYITSESIVNTSSGSTAFGNSSDDSHTFQGHITASQNISSSGTIIGGGLNINGTTTFNDGNITNVEDINLDRLRGDSATDVQIGLGTAGISFIAEDGDKFTFNEGEKNVDLLYFNSDESNFVFFDASTSKVGIGDDISQTPAKTLTVKGDISASGDLKVDSHITASGDISGSGTGSFSHLVVDRPFGISDEEFFQIKKSGTTKFAIDEDGDITTYGRIIGGSGNPNQFDGTIGGHTGYTSNYINFNANPMEIRTGGNVVLETTSTTAKFNYPLTVGNLTASSNISSSGDISAFTGTGSFGAVHTTGNISSSGTINANKVQIGGTGVVSDVAASATQGRLTQTKDGISGAINLTDLGTTGNPTFNNITADSDISVARNILHVGNTSTQIGFDTDKITNNANQIVLNGPVTASGHISASGTIYGKQIHYQHHAYLEDSDHGENFIPMAGTLAEVSTAQYYNKKIAPYDGEILKVLINCENDPGDTSVIFYKNGTKEAKETITDGSIGTDTAIFEVLNTYPLVGIGTADRTFSQGDILSISINPANAPGEVVVTTVWSYTVKP